MVTGITDSGFEYTITDERMDDFEIVELLMEAERDLTKAIEAARRMLGAEQFGALKEHTRKDGRISTAEMLDEINEILTGSAKVKN